MWYQEFTFFDKQIGMKKIPLNNYFSRQLTDLEIEQYPDIKKLYPEFLEKDKFKIPIELNITTEYRELLEYSNGGGIVNGEREFGYFSIQDIRYYYFAYGFPKWTPYFLPIAFNGGGKFYAYDFRNITDVKIVAVGSGDLDYDSSVVLGSSLWEVLNKKTNIEDELDTLHPEIKLSEKEIKKTTLNNELTKLKKDKLDGKIDLKTYLKQKKIIEIEIKKIIN